MAFLLGAGVLAGMIGSAGGIASLISYPELLVFPRRWTHYLHSVSAAEPLKIPLSLLFLELSGCNVSAVRLHVTAADALVRPGVDRVGFR